MQFTKKFYIYIYTLNAFKKNSFAMILTKQINDVIIFWDLNVFKCLYNLTLKYLKLHLNTDSMCL